MNTNLPTPRAWKAAATALASLALAACTAGASAGATAVRPAAAVASTVSSPTQDPGPSAVAQMICSAEIRTDVQTILGLKTAPATATTWTDQLYTCTYTLPGGHMVLSVKESPDATSADAYLAGQARQMPAAAALTGARGLGNPGYESPSGIVVILKDGKTLKVDATGMPPASGPSQLTRDDLAYEITTDILGCWTGK